MECLTSRTSDGKKRLSQSHIATVVVQESGGGKMNQEQVDAMCPEERR